MAVADVLISKLLDSSISLVTGEIHQRVKLVAGVENELQQLTTTLRSLQAVLIDAERRQLKQEAVQLWLEKLRLIAYDVDDVLDEWNTAILQSKIDATDTLNPTRSKVRSIINSICFCFGFHEVGFRHDIAIKIRDFNKSLDAIAKQKENYDFQQIQGTSQSAQRVMTTSIVNIPEIKGREHDKNKVIQLLLEENELNPHVISLVGMGGIGKTTLAKLLYNEDRVKSNFHETIWVCVSDPFDEIRIAKAILESLQGETPNLVELQNIAVEIQKHMEGRKFLLILDDVWNEDAEKWKQVEDFLKCGSPGSKILVTTRNEDVAMQMGCSPKNIVKLRLLPHEECWSIFTQVVYPKGNHEMYNESLEEIGRKIVEKCKGLPLAVKTIGGLLRFKESVEEWQRVLDSEMWELKKVEREVFAPLRLSYDDLSPSLKQCLLYCVIFPKDHEICKRDLIKMWASQGYLRKAHNKGIEVIGDEYFQNLAMRSFFQDFQFDEWDESVTHFKMHDVVHDFVDSLVMKKEYCSIEVYNVEERMTDCNENKIFHVGIVLRKRAPFPSSLCTLEKLRSLVVFSDFKFEGSLADIFDQLTCLRSLSLGDCDIEKVPPNISKLVHLRHLDLSCNRRLKELPETICNLYNLQTLDVDECISLESLPRDIGKLVNLKCLYNDYCKFLLPKEIGKLNGLERLSRIKIDDDEREALCLGDIKNLNQLGGSLEIILTRQVRDAKEGVLTEKNNLSQLSLWFSCRAHGGREGQYEELIEALEAPPNLKYLKIYHYNGTKSPSWMSSLTYLKNVELWGWSSCEELPSLGNLPSLECLKISWFECLKRIGDEFVGMNKNKIAGASSTTPAFPRLTELVIKFMYNWEEWNEEDEDEVSKKQRNSGEEQGIITRQIMPCLRFLTLQNCPKLKALPSYITNNTSLQCDIWCL